MSTRSGRIRASVIESSPPRTRKGISPPRSPARTRKISPAPKISPARTSSAALRKSPSRKSPSRKPASKYPVRKSPSRAVKETTENDTQKPQKNNNMRTDLSVKLEDFSSKLEIYRSTRSKRMEYSVKDVTSTTDDFAFEKFNGFDTNEGLRLKNRKSVEEVPPRRSSKSIDFIESVPDRRSSSKSVSKSISQSIDTLSDQENSADEYINEKPTLVTRKLATPSRLSESRFTKTGHKWEFGGRIGTALLILLLPLTALITLISCKKSCSTISVHDFTKYNSLSSWFSVPAVILVLSQYALQALFAVTPICGINADKLDDTQRKYCFNALFSSILTISLIYTLDFFDIFDTDILLSENIKLAVISYIFAVLLSIILYVKSKYVNSSELNSYGNTGYTLYDFFMGREIHPCLQEFDIKIWISRVSNINTMIFILLIFKNAIEINIESLEIKELSINNINKISTQVNVQHTMLVFSIMQLTYILSYIMKEHKVTTTFFWQSEGVGYLQTVSSALYPYYFSAISKFVTDNKLVFSTNILIAACGLYVLGYFIMLVSNNIKHEFRTKPFHPTFTNMESMPTFHGKKLLVTNMWGFLRHPNYTGDILIHMALAIPGIVSQQYFASLPAVLTIVMLTHRAWRDHSRCNRRYGSGWTRYCKRVPSVIIPKIL